MGKKEKTGHKKTDGGNEDEKGEQKLQAIVLADSFTKSFRPMTWRKPKVLLPLVNVPMLEYTIEFLAQNGVEEMFIFCVWHADMLQDYINNSKWPSTISVKCITSSACLSAGDALRELDSMGIIRSDPFILISGDVISNMDLQKALKYHKEKRKSDSNAIMTVVLKRVQRTAGVKPVMDDLVVALDKSTSQLLYFEDSVQSDSMNIPLEILEEHPAISCRSDLLDCHIDICSPELLLQFSDNFDYQNIRRHFIRNEVVNWELGKHLYGYILQNEYAARVHDLRTYHHICRDIISRWVYPLVPDSQLLGRNSFTQTQSRRYNYREGGVKVSRDAVIGTGVAIGFGSVISAGAVLDRAVIGRNCVIGEGAVIEDSHIWAGVTVEANAVIKLAIICDGAIIKKGATVNRGCVLSYGVALGEGVTLREYSRVTLTKLVDEEDDSEDGEETEESGEHGDPYDHDVVGADGRGYVWRYEGGGDYDDLEEDEEDEEEVGKQQGVDVLRASCAGCREEEDWKRRLWSTMPLPEDSDDEDEDFTDVGAGYVMSSQGSSEAQSVKYQMEKLKVVIRDMVTTGYKESNKPDNLLMEIKGYKFAQNKEFSDCIHGVVPALLEILLGNNASNKASEPAVVSQNSVLLASKNLLQAGGWGYSVLKPLIQNESDQLAVVEAFEISVLQSSYRSVLTPVFRILLQILYDADIVTEESLLVWIARRQKGEAPKHLSTGLSSELIALFSQPSVQEFVEWLQADEDEEESTDDDDEEDD